MKKEYPFDKKYIVYCDGRVFSKKTNKFLKPFVRSRLKYNALQLKIRGKRKNKNLSVLILETFVSPRPNGFHAAHLNGKNNDDRLENLAWTSPKENASHKKNHGTYLFGEKVNFAKLNESDIFKIRKMSLNKKQTEIAKKFSVCKKTISRILSGKTWKHLRRPESPSVGR